VEAARATTAPHRKEQSVPYLRDRNMAHSRPVPSSRAEGDLRQPRDRRGERDWLNHGIRVRRHRRYRGRLVTSTVTPASDSVGFAPRAGRDVPDELAGNPVQRAEFGLGERGEHPLLVADVDRHGLIGHLAPLCVSCTSVMRRSAGWATRWMRPLASRRSRSPCSPRPGRPAQSVALRLPGSRWQRSRSRPIRAA
jgi:hypothetical protein